MTKRFVVADADGRAKAFYADNAGAKPPPNAIEISDAVYRAWVTRTHDQALVNGILTPIASSVKRYVSFRNVLDSLHPDERTRLHAWIADTDNLMWLLDVRYAGQHLLMDDGKLALVAMAPLISSGVLTEDRVKALVASRTDATASTT